MKVKATWEFDVDISDFDGKFVDIFGIAKDLTKREIDSMLQSGLLTADVFEYEVVKDAQLKIEFEECYISTEYNTITGYFIVDKTILDTFKPNQYPDAEHGTISIEYPINYPEAAHTSFSISPTKDGLDYDWTDIPVCNEILDFLINTTEKHARKVKGEYL